MSDLKPCPFCENDRLYFDKDDEFLSVQCVCDATGPIAHRWKSGGECQHSIEHSRKDASGLWNARPEEDRLKAQNAELIYALERIACPKMYDCANWVKIDHIKEFARKAISAARESHE